MTEQYTSLQKNECQLYSIGSPIILEAYALLKHNETEKIIAQVKFKNLGKKNVVAIYIRIRAFDITGEELAGIAEFQYLDLDAKQGDSFGQRKPVIMLDDKTRSIEIGVQKVVFADREIWEPAPNACWESIPEQESLYAHFENNELIKQYKLLSGSQVCQYVPKRFKDLILCTCGAPLKEDAAACFQCRRKLDNLFSVTDDEVHKKYEEKIAEEKAKRAAEERVRREREQAEKERKLREIREEQLRKEERERKAKQRIAVLAVITAAALFLAGSVMMLTMVIIPAIRYNHAVKLVERGEYEDAITSFEKLKDYKDSKELLVECKYGILDRKYNKEGRDMDHNDYVAAVLGEARKQGHTKKALRTLENANNLLNDERIWKAIDELMKSQWTVVKHIVAFREDASSYWEYEYDKNGNLTKEMMVASDGSVDGWNEYEYDGNGNLIKEIWFDLDGSVDDWIEYEYDKNENLIKEMMVASDGSVNGWNEYEYDINGNLIKEISYGSGDFVLGWNEYEYDINGNLIKTIWYESGSVDGWIEYEYDINGNLIEETPYSSDGSIWWRYEYEYDEKGNLIKKLHSGSDFSTLGWNECEYDENGNLIKEISYESDGSIWRRDEYEYGFFPLL